MVRFFLRRLFIIPFVLVLVNFAGFAFAHITFQLQLAQTVYGSGKEGFTPVLPVYQEYLQKALQGDFGSMPVGLNVSITESVWQATLASLGLILIAYTLSLVVGLALGLGAVRVDPPQVHSWLTWTSTAGLAMPSFYIGTLLVGGILYLSIRTGSEPIIPVAGSGWGIYLILPVIALMIRPAMQISQVTSNLLAGELNQRYVVAARSFGHTWRAIRWNKALKNVIAPIIITMAGTFRLLIGDLLIVEWLFNWPGIGRMLVQTLVPPSLSSVGGLVDTSAFFLYAPLVAFLLVIFTLMFLLADTISSGLARKVDPRLSRVEEEVVHD